MASENIHPTLLPLARPISWLKQDPRNARRHSDVNVDAIAESLDTFGQDQTVVTNKAGRIIKGHGRYLAALKLGWQRLAVLVVDDDELRAQARALADNRSSDLADYNPEFLAEIISDLARENRPDAPVVGFSDTQVAAILTSLRRETPPETAEPAPPDSPILPPEASPDARTVQIVLDSTTYPVFLARVEALRGKYGTLAFSDTVLQALDDACRANGLGRID